MSRVSGAYRMLLVVGVVSWLVWNIAFKGDNTLNYVALGDSITLGVEVSNDENYVSKFAVGMSRDLGRPVRAKNLGVGETTSSNLLESLRTDSNVRSAVAHADVITIGIGTNDYGIAKAFYLDGKCGGREGETCLRNITDNYKRNYDQVIAEIKRLTSSCAQTTLIRFVNVYNYVVGEDVASGNFEIFNPYLVEMNEYVLSKASAHGLKVADAHLLFNGPSGMEDAFSNGYTSPPLALHPSPWGHTVIARALRANGYEELQRRGVEAQPPSRECPRS